MGNLNIQQDEPIHTSFWKNLKKIFKNDLPEIAQPWIIVTVIGDVSNMISSFLIVLVEPYGSGGIFLGDSKFFMGLGAMFSWINIMKYLKFYPQFYVSNLLTPSLM